MRFLLLLILIVSPFLTPAQLVITIAGQPEVEGNLDGPATLALFNNPHGLAVDKNGITYTADRWSHTIRKMMPNGEVTTLAGANELIGDQDGQGSDARFYEPWGIAVDNNGIVYVADTRNNKIRKIAPDGTVTTIAGTGNFGTSDGYGPNATFGNPTGIDVDDAGNIYVADHLTHIIRKIDTNGNVTTIAGTPYLTGWVDGTGRNAQFHRPYGLHVGQDSMIYIADEWNHLIRKMSPEGEVTTLAGIGQVGSQNGFSSEASFNYPWDMTTDDQGNVFVADGYNYLIRKITPEGYVSSYAGKVAFEGAEDGVGDEASFSGATAIDFHPATKELYIGDAYNNLIRKIIDLNQGITVLPSNGNTEICANETLELVASPDIYSDYVFYINGIKIQENNGTTLSLDGLESGIKTITVKAQNNGDEISSNSLDINVLAVPEASISIIGETTFFEGDSVTLIASNGTDYFWSNGETTQTITVFTSGIYTVEITDNKGCIGTSEGVTISVRGTPDAPVISINNANESCPGQSIRLSSSYDTNNQWLENGWPIEDAVNKDFYAPKTGAYQVQVTLQDGTIVLSEPVEIVIKEKNIVDFYVDKTKAATNEMIRFEAQINGVADLEWNFGDPSMGSNNISTQERPDFAYQLPGNYTVQLVSTDTNGCQDTLVKENLIEVIGENLEVFIPSAFSPNDDGLNDVFLVRSESIAEVEMLIFNQWGEQIFKSEQIETGWTGMYKGRPAQCGTYTYLIKVTKDNGTEKLFNGKVSILR